MNKDLVDISFEPFLLSKEEWLKEVNDILLKLNICLCDSWGKLLFTLWYTWWIKWKMAFHSRRLGEIKCVNFVKWSLIPYPSITSMYFIRNWLQKISMGLSWMRELLLMVATIFPQIVWMDKHWYIQSIV